MSRLVKPSLLSLPVELLYEVHIFARNPFLAISCKHIHLILKNAPTIVKVDYLLAEIPERPTFWPNEIQRVLQYPLCNRHVLERCIGHILPPDHHLDPPSDWPDLSDSEKEKVSFLFPLPKRLFRDLDQPTVRDETLVTVQYLANLPIVYRGRFDTNGEFVGRDVIRLAPNPDLHQGYALIRAAQARCIPLIQLLLELGANPSRRNGLAILIAIQQRDLELVKLLVNSEEKREEVDSKKKSKQDSSSMNSILLDEAVKARASDIVEWLVKEKGCVPDMKTLRAMG